MSMSSEIAAPIEEPNDLIIRNSNSQVISDQKLLGQQQFQINKQPSTTTSQGSDITLSQRMISACTGAFLTSLVVTPFDVVRIRLQQQELLYPSGLKNATECCRKVFWEGEPAQPAEAFCKSNTTCVQEAKINGTFSGISKIATNEGVPTLYRGLTLTLLMAVPSNVVYFSGYEFLRDSSPLANNYPILNPLLCGAIARVFAATTVSPLELIKTRLQAVPSQSSYQKSSDIMKMVLQNSLKEIKSNGILSVFKGLELTLWRDVPFSAIYWASYEFLSKNLKKTEMFKESTDQESSLNSAVFTRSFLSGSTAGLISAVFTNPFDVGKTRKQVSLDDSKKMGSLSSLNPAVKESMFRYMFKIYSHEGISALFVGLLPRCLKISPSCAIMISSYEVSKRFFADIKNNA